MLSHGARRFAAAGAPLAGDPAAAALTTVSHNTAEIRRHLTEALKQMDQLSVKQEEKHAAVFTKLKSSALTLSVHDLLEGLQLHAYDEDTPYARTHDEGGLRMDFGLLAAPASHTVRFHLKGEDLVFRDQLSCAEHLGVMKWTNRFCYIMYPLCFSIGNLLSLTALPLGVFIMSGLWVPSPTAERAIFGLWVLYFGPNTLW